ncbi:MAG: hypothetical protein LUB63_06385, partial [Oscillospiraceae bacterium]|nr:hypothetical protein [Oscillospiraceae bacterium]
MKRLKVKKAMATVLAVATLVSALGISAFADDTSSTKRTYSDDVYSENAPSKIAEVDSTVLSGSTAAANNTVLEILGINVTSTDAAGVYNSAGTNGQSS